MSEKLVHRRDPIRLFVSNNQERGHPFQEFVHVGKKKVDLVIVVSVKGGSANSGQLDHILNRDFLERAFFH